MSLCILALGVAVCASTCKPEPLDDLTLGAVLRDAATVVHGHAPSAQRLAVGWAQVRLEGGARPRCFNLGSLGANGADPFWLTGGHRFRAFGDYVDGAQAYWRAVCGSALPYFDAGDGHGAGLQLARCGYHRTDPETYAGAMAALAVAATRRVLPKL